ncbi:MAG TPA: hypothetical protein VEC36_09770 [Patescibacteria group bacterium]|nr:hypothetical protein [Patescibacteria group bacterium]
MKIIFFLLFFVLAAFIKTSAQAMLDETEGFEEILGQTQDENADPTPQLDAIEYFSERPILLRTARPRDLMLLPGFNASIARQVLQLVKNDSAISFPTISQTLYLSPEQSFILEKCTSLEFHPPKQKVVRSKTPVVVKAVPSVLYRARNQQNFAEQHGFKTGSYVGSQLQLYQRLQYRAEDYSAGILTSKSPGEISLADFVSGYAEADVFETHFVAGDFSIESGMGSILWRGFGMRKGSNVIAPAVKYSSALLPYRSSTEVKFFRGLAATRFFKTGDSAEIQTMLWASKTPRTALIDEVSGVVTSLKTDGYYRTETEITQKNNIHETTFGGKTELHFSSFKVGATAFYLDYGHEILGTSTTAFRGGAGVLGSFHALYFKNNFSAAAEFSRDARGNFGFKSGMNFHEKEFETALAVRSFGAEFRSPFGFSFGEFSAPANEFGVYAGFLWKATHDFKSANYMDVYRSFSPRFGVPLPTRGLDIFSENSLKTSTRTTLILRARTENKTDAFKNPDNSYTLFSGTRSSVRFEAQHRFKNANFRARIEAAHLDFEGAKLSEWGVAGFLDGSYQVFKALKIFGRIAYFSTESYQSAIWQFESIAPGALASAPLYGEGSRSYIGLQFEPFEFLKLSTRYAATFKNNVQTLGSGNAETEGNKDERLLVQLDVVF